VFEYIVRQTDNAIFCSIHPRGMFCTPYSRDRAPRLLITEWQLAYIVVLVRVRHSELQTSVNSTNLTLQKRTVLVCPATKA